MDISSTLEDRSDSSVHGHASNVPIEVALETLTASFGADCDERAAVAAFQALPYQSSV
jgi:hypothetical protein